MSDLIPFDEIRASGECVLVELRQFHPSLAYDAESIAWLDGYIERNRHVFTDEGRYGVALGFGYVLGETIIRTLGGTWEYDEQFREWIVNVGPPVGKANPIGKAYKQLSQPFESMASMLRITTMVREKGGWDNIGTRLGEKESE